MTDLLSYLPTAIDSGLGALGIGLVVKLRALVDSVVAAQAKMLDRLEAMDQRVTDTERRLRDHAKLSAVA